MERKILFKGKKLSDGTWAEGDLLHKDGKTYIYGSYIDESGVYIEDMPVDSSTVCQFTGLKDKKGKDIFENDVMEITYENGYIQKCVVEYFQDTFIGVNGGMHIPICLYGGCDKDILKGVVNLGSKFDRKEGEK